MEHPFGHFKRNLGMTNFLLRGMEGVQAEFSIAATCFNIVRMITLFGGVKGFIGRPCKV
ncbi:MAG: transposase [Thermodesulfobacteriota bacterium]